MILQYAVENDILNLDDVRRKIMKKENENYLKMHEEHHKIWFDEKANQWMTYIDDPSTKRGIALKRRKEKADLDNLIIEHYRAIEEIPKVSNVFYEWINLKFEYGEISPQSKTRYENDFARFFSDDNLICSKNFSEITALDLETFIKGNIKKHRLTKKLMVG